MKELRRKRVAIYARVSTEMQSEEGYSISGQINQITEYCEYNNFLVVNTYKDCGISGKSMNRPELQRMMKDAKEGHLDCIMVYKTNRLARNTSDLLYIVEELHRQNVEFFSLSERMEVNTSSGKLMLQILASFSEFERNNIVENVFMGQARRAQEGYYQGNLPLGYDKIPDTTKELMLNQHETNIVKYIYKSYSKGHGYRKIANELNKKGYVTKKGKPFSTAAIKYILTNPFYIGKIRFAKYKNWNEQRRKGLNDEPIIADGKHTPIISKDLWDKVQLRMKEVSKKPQVHGKGTNVLTGLLRCPQCGHAMAASNTTNTLKDGTKKKIRYYSCSQFRNKGAKVCKANSIRADVIEKYVLDQMIAITQNEKIIQKVVESVNNKNKVDVSALNHSIAYKQDELDEIKIKQNNLIKTVADNPDLADILKDTIHQYENRITEISAQIQNLQNEQTKDTETFDAQKISTLLRAIFSKVETLEKNQLKSLYLTIIDEIQVRKDENNKKQFYITLKINNDVITQIFDNQPFDEVLLDTSSFFFQKTLYIHL